MLVLNNITGLNSSAIPVQLKESYGKRDFVWLRRGRRRGCRLVRFLRGRGRFLDQDRLLQEARRVDVPSEARQGNGLDRNSRELVSGRSPAHDVHQESAQQPWFRQSA